ncbi:MAG: hypothetical protein NVSMB25_10710 [Thermoleophilaceae bacterium]
MLGLALLPLCAGGASPAAAQPGRLAGINPQFLPPASDAPARARAFDRIRALGVSVSRIDGNWADVERQPGVYDWTRLDRQIGELVAEGQAPEVILDFGNPLYSTRGALAAAGGGGGVPPFGTGAAIYFPPDSPEPFARWAAALAARYRGRVHQFEVWNEENLGWRFWEPHEDPAAYATLLERTYTAVKAQAPEDQVAFGGTFYPAVDAASAAASGVPLPPDATASQLALPHQGTLEFLQNALAAAPDLGRYMDAVAYHPYHFPYAAPEVRVPAEGSLEDSMIAVRALLDSHGLSGEPVWITEVGWPNNTLAYGASLEKSASYLVRTFVTAWSHAIDYVSWYCYGDGPNWQYNQEDAFGVVDPGGAPKPAYLAWQTLNRLVLSLPFSGSIAGALGLPADGHALRFAAGGHAVTVVWLAPETVASDQGPQPPADQRAMIRTPAGTTQIVDMRGRSLGRTQSFEASPYPVYLIADDRTASSRPHGRRARPRRHRHRRHGHRRHARAPRLTG